MATRWWRLCGKLELLSAAVTSYMNVLALHPLGHDGLPDSPLLSCGAQRFAELRLFTKAFTFLNTGLYEFRRRDPSPLALSHLRIATARAHLRALVTFGAARRSCPLEATALIGVMVRQCEHDANCFMSTSILSPIQPQSTRPADGCLQQEFQIPFDVSVTLKMNG